MLYFFIFQYFFISQTIITIESIACDTESFTSANLDYKSSLSYVLVTDCTIQLSSKNIKMSNTNGILDLNFQTPVYKSCNFSKYLVNLLVDESVSKNNCKISFGDYLRHTKEYWYEQNEINKLQEENERRHIILNNEIRAQFAYVYTGCYQIRVTPDSSSHYVEPSIKYTFWVDSDYIKETIKKPRFSTPSIPKDNMLEMNFQFTTKWDWDIKISLIVVNLENKPKSKEVHLKKCMADKLQHETGYVYDAVNYNQYFNMYVSNECKYYNNTVSQLCLPTCQNSAALKGNGSCKPETSHIQCYYLNNTPLNLDCSVCGLLSGSYKVSLELFGPQCTDDNEVWTSKPCHWIWPLNYSEDLTKSYYQPHAKEQVTIIVTTFILLATVLIVITVCIIRKKRCIDANPYIDHKVLLVYARDCEQFMSVVQKFSMLLRMLGNFEVFDIFDDHYFENISVSPSEWLENKLNNQKIGVIFISTLCGDIIQQHSMELANKVYSVGQEDKKHLIDVGHTSAYRTERCFDNFFLYAFKMLKTKDDQFITVRFPDFTPKIMSSFLKPKAQIVLPNKINQVFKYLNISMDLQTLHKSSCYEELINAIEDAKAFVDMNPDYKTEMLQLDVPRYEQNTKTFKRCLIYKFFKR